MNTNKLLSVLRDVRLLKFVSTDELQQFANDYPYFQQAHILLAKKYLADNNTHFEEKLHIAAIYASDRNNLRAIMVNGAENGVKQDISVNIPQELISGNSKINDELIYASMSDTLPVQDNLPEDTNLEGASKENTITEAAAMGELETALQPSDIINEDELSHASMSDTLPIQDTLLEEENYDAVAEENTNTEATAMEELEAASLPADSVTEDELIHASMSDVLPADDNLLEEENYEVVFEENTATEATAVEELELTTQPVAKTNGNIHSETFNINQPHTFSDWLKFIQSMPRSLQHKSSAPDYQPISVPELPKDELPEQHIPLEFVPETLVAEPEDNIEAIDEFVAETKHTGIPIKAMPVKEMADKSLEEDDELLTETLAQVYGEQQLYNKAIRVYAKLSLKFPEKSVYFASRIKELKSKL